MNTKLRVGLLLDSFTVCAWEYAMLERIVHSDYAEIQLIILNDGEPPDRSHFERVKKRKNRLVYYWYTKLDELIFRNYPDAFARKDSRTLVETVDVYPVAPIREGVSDYFHHKDIQAIKDTRLDVLVRMGFRVLKGEILTASRYGVWSYHHGDNTVNRGGPPGFWETVESWDETGSMLQILNEDLDGGIVLYRSWARTYPLSVARNKNRYFWKTLSFLPRKLEELHRVGEKVFFRAFDNQKKPIDFYDRRLYTAPGNLHAFLLVMKQLLKIFRRMWQKIFYLDHWLLLFHCAEDVSTSLRRFQKMTPPKDRFWADPHLVFKDGKHYVFIEECLHETRKGHISAFEIRQDGTYTTPVKVLERDYHLSYPFIFEDDGKMYMIPETYDNETIELYECVEFPSTWKYNMTLMENIRAVDVTVLYYENTWWLFAGVEENKGACPDDELFLFYSDRLCSSDWIPHPMNPIVSDVKSARPAGKIFIKDGKLLRPSQNGSKLYGHGLNINEIDILTKTAYHEQLMTSVKPSWDDSIEGIHTFSYEHGITIVDAFTRRRKLG